MSKKNTSYEDSDYRSSIVNKAEEKYTAEIKVINGKRYTLVGENKVPTRVEPSMKSVTHV